MRKLTLPLKLLLVAVISLVVFSRPASAQTSTASITINTGTQATQLVDSNNNAVTHTYTSDHPFWVNLDECHAGWKYQISVTTVGTGSTNMEVWATTSGNDCSTTQLRFLSPACYRVGYFGVNEGTYAYYIPVQTVVGQHFFGPDVSQTNTTVIQGTSDDCDTVASGSTTRTGVSIVLYFYIFAGTSTGTPTYSATWSDGGYDLMGPAAPGTVGAQPADTELYMNWSQVLDSDLAGYRIFCQDCAEGGSSVCDLYSSKDAGETECPTTPGDLIPGCLPNGSYLKGSVTDKLATSGLAQHLTNGTKFGCAVAGFDTRQNSGNLSTLVASTPWYVNDFYSAYRNNAHGKGGGGFCSIGQRNSEVGLLIPLASLCLLALRRGRAWNRRADKSSRDTV